MTTHMLSAGARSPAATSGRRGRVGGRKAFSPNVIEEWSLGEGRELTERSGLTFRSRYPGLAHALAGFGCGDVEAVDGHGSVVRRWEDMAFLFFRRPRLNRILHERAVVQTGTGSRAAASPGQHRALSAV